MFTQKYSHKEIELLAPAKDVECGKAAIDCGADALYIGAPRFGAREAAGNTLDDIADLAEHAHKYWARVYVTVNTLLRDEEIPEALRIINRLHEIGVDGLIIQDTGLLECDLPPIPLIASTQMHNSTPEKTAFLENVGFQRVILARELDLEQVRAIRERTNIELEFFIHGALCVCYSGQCYLSYALGGRSGNRGQCAQPCRKPYSLLDGQGRVIARNKHLLSLKDINLTDHLTELIGAGVCSFKIEGRLKDRAYVTNVVAHYRAKLDEAIAELGLGKSSSGASSVGFTPNLDKTFNRGYSTHFLHGRRAGIGSIDTPKMVGEVVGRVTSAGRKAIVIDSDVELHPGDGICYFDRDGSLRGSVVNAVRGALVEPDKPGGIREGTIVYRNNDHEFLSRFLKARIERRIGVKLTLREAPCGLLLEAVDEDGVTAEFVIECDKQSAEKPDQALESIRRQLAKCGGTEFACAEVLVDLPEALFVPISILNTLRRGALENLVSARARNRPVRQGGPIANDVPYPENELTFEGNVLNSHAEAFYRRHGVISIEPAAESGIDLRGRKVMTTRFCVRHQLGMCDPTCANPLSLIDTEGHTLELRFDCDNCRMEVILVGQASSA